MIERVITACLRNHSLTILGALLLVVFGCWALLRTPVDAIPDISDNQVIVYATWEGRSSKVIADQVTYPLASSLQGLPRVRAVRSSTMFGVSMVYVIFEDAVDLYWARSRVQERLSQLADRLPRGVTPVLGPDGTGVGHVYWYVLKGNGQSLGELRTIQDTYLRNGLQTVPGVAEVASVGGFEKQYQIDLNPLKLHDLRIPAQAVVRAVSLSNRDVGGDVVERSAAEFQVRGRGYLRGKEDIENIVVATSVSGVPVYVKNLGVVQIGGGSRRGLLDENGEGEVVGGIVVMRSGENAKAVIGRVKEKLAGLGKGLPAGVRVTTAYDRSELIDRAIDTLSHALLEEIVLVTLAHILFLWHFRSILIVTAPLPLAILFSFLCMNLAGMNSNIMSLGGIAIAIGVLVDAGIVMTENVIRHAERHGAGYEEEIVPITEKAAHQVGRPIFFAMAIIILAFVPVFALTGTEGKMFRPLALTKTFAMVSSAILAVTLVPVLCSLLVRGKLRREEDNRLMAALTRLYRPALAWALDNRKKTVATALLLFVVALALTTRIGKEFMPPLNEGSLLFMPVTLPNVSINEAKRLVTLQDRIIRETPEVGYVLGKVGRADTPTDPSPLSMFETIILLKPQEKWRAGMTTEKLVAELNEKLQIPGVGNGWTMPIINRINMLSTGVRTDLGVKIYGDNLDTLSDLAVRAAEILKEVPGAADVVAERTQGGMYLDIEVDRAAAARYGLSADDVNSTIETVLGGMVATSTIEGRGRFPVRVRFLGDYRQDLEAIRRIPIPRGALRAPRTPQAASAAVYSPGGGMAPAGMGTAAGSSVMGETSPTGVGVTGMGGGGDVLLGQVTRISCVPGPAMINAENSFLRSVVFLNVRGRDMGRFVDEARAHLEKKLKLPPGCFMEWSGQYENHLRARKTLQVVVPLVLLIIFVLLVMVYRSVREALHVILAVPFALTGGVYLLYFTGYNFSVAVWVGFIALFGTAVQTGVVMVIYLDEAVARVRKRDGRLTRENLREAVTEGALLRLRPKVMTVSTIVAGLIPIFWSSRTGAEIMKPLATPVLGGMISSLLHVLIVTPVIFAWLRERELAKVDKAVAVGKAEGI
ncbi:efflux RND transporter permease subunit [Geobacter pickeringii]|uniref:Cation transporter n=1 Tax=Geobacter pickeringii TaxID=345632 RepID=A0A0B5BDM7_9BACT|nr:CusA/CzcA family heavy metal efflux RND transporter [Geobacter pickeringii]AJE02181.1 cation transporter [Geobacter pickeringii]